MDTITHGIAGALAGKALFGGQDLFSRGPVDKARIVSWSLMLAAIFPDSDSFRGMFGNNELLIMTWHRSITHSLFCLPFFALALAGLTRVVARARRWPAPSFAVLALIYGAGILSHILLDLVTSFGTMIWSPLGWSRPAWDILFIVDFTFTAILLLPQILAWIYRDPQKIKRRALGMWLVFLPAPVLIAALGRIVGAPISERAVLSAIVIFSALLLLPSLRGWGLRISHAAWNRAGLAGSLLYIALAFFAHRAALDRVTRFAAFEHIEASSIGAMPFPPSLGNWDGLIRTPRGVYELRMDLSRRQEFQDAGPDTSPGPIEYSFFPDAPPNAFINAARELPEIRIFFWFARFPVTRFHKEGGDAVVEFSDLRFPKIRPDRPASFTYRVRFNSSGAIVEQGLAKN